MRKLILFWVILFASMLSAAADNLDEFLGLRFPQLKTDPSAWVIASDTVYGTPFSVDVMVHLFLSENGKVDSIGYDSKAKPDFIRGVKNSLELLQFEPGEIMERAMPLVLPVRVTFSSAGNARRADLTLPYDFVTGFRERSLIDRTLTENGITCPGLDYFPSYYLNVPRDSGRAEYDYAIFRVSVDDSGQVIDFILYSTSNEKLAELFAITARYARFRGARYGNKDFSAELYLIARFFDGLHYPTAVWPVDSLTANSLLYIDRYRLETYLYLDSLIGPAYPENLSGTFGYGGMLVEKDSIPVHVNITSAGQIEWATYEKHISTKTRDDLNAILKQVKFIPALDSSGHAVPYRGRILITRSNDSNKLRISADWLP